MPRPVPPFQLTLVRDQAREDGACDTQKLKPYVGDPNCADEEITGEYAIEDLYTRFAPYVARIATKILGREGEVQDVVQDVFAAAVGGLRVRSEMHQVKSWLAKVAVRTSMRKLRARSLWRLFDLDEAPQYDTLADPGAGPYEAQLVSEVYEALDRVSPADRVAWVLRYVEGESLESAADLCACSLATIKRRIRKAHLVVQKQVGGQGSASVLLGGDCVT